MYIPLKNIFLYCCVYLKMVITIIFCNYIFYGKTDLKVLNYKIKFKKIKKI